MFVCLFVCMLVFWKGRGGEGKHLSGNLCKSGLKHFTSEKDFAPNLKLS